MIKANSNINYVFRGFRIIIPAIYWIFSCFALIDIIKGEGDLFPNWVNNSLFPGYFLGFILGYAGGDFWAFIGQIISLSILLLISFGFCKLLNLSSYKN
ncbi:MAG: hypothetical protein WCK02_18115 [Bacteroidota bacterium]